MALALVVRVRQSGGLSRAQPDGQSRSSPQHDVFIAVAPISCGGQTAERALAQVAHAPPAVSVNTAATPSSSIVRLVIRRTSFH